jgi:hypothetical protein
MKNLVLIAAVLLSASLNAQVLEELKEGFDLTYEGERIELRENQYYYRVTQDLTRFFQVNHYDTAGVIEMMVKVEEIFVPNGVDHGLTMDTFFKNRDEADPENEFTHEYTMPDGAKARIILRNINQWTFDLKVVEFQIDYPGDITDEI